MQGWGLLGRGRVLGEGGGELRLLFACAGSGGGRSCWGLVLPATVAMASVSMAVPGAKYARIRLIGRLLQIL